MRIGSAAAAALKTLRLSKTRRSGCCRCVEGNISFLFHDLPLKRFVSCCERRGGGDLLLSFSRFHIANSRSGGDVFYRWAACTCTRSTARPGTTTTFLLSPNQKIWYSWEPLAWLLEKEELLRKVPPKLRLTMESKSYPDQSHILTYLHRLSLTSKSYALSNQNHKQLAQLMYKK